MMCVTVTVVVVVVRKEVVHTAVRKRGTEEVVQLEARHNADCTVQVVQHIEQVVYCAVQDVFLAGA